MLAGLSLEEIDASLAQGDGHLDALISKHKILRWGQEIGNYLDFPQGFIRVGYFLSHTLASLFASTPRTVDSYYFVTVREPDRENSTFDFAKTVATLFLRAVGRVSRNDTLRIDKGKLRLRERNTVLSPILTVLSRVPLEPCFRHSWSVAQEDVKSHIFIWLSLGRAGSLTFADQPRRPTARVGWNGGVRT